MFGFSFCMYFPTDTAKVSQQLYRQLIRRQLCNWTTELDATIFLSGIKSTDSGMYFAWDKSIKKQTNNTRQKKTINNEYSEFVWMQTPLNDTSHCQKALHATQQQLPDVLLILSHLLNKWIDQLLADLLNALTHHCPSSFFSQKVLTTQIINYIISHHTQSLNIFRIISATTTGVQVAPT